MNIKTNCPGKQEMFKMDLRRTLGVVIAGLDSGTVGISRDCLWQMAAGKISHSMHAPVGVNAPYFARQVFDSVVSEKAFTKFVY